MGERLHINKYVLTPQCVLTKAIFAQSVQNIKNYIRANLLLQHLQTSPSPPQQRLLNNTTFSPHSHHFFTISIILSTSHSPPSSPTAHTPFIIIFLFPYHPLFFSSLTFFPPRQPLPLSLYIFWSTPPPLHQRTPFRKKNPKSYHLFPIKISSTSFPISKELCHKGHADIQNGKGLKKKKERLLYIYNEKFI